jgi:hypothetical protein
VGVWKVPDFLLGLACVGVWVEEGEVASWYLVRV